MAKQSTTNTQHINRLHGTLEGWRITYIMSTRPRSQRPCHLYLVDDRLGAALEWAKRIKENRDAALLLGKATPYPQNRKRDIARGPVLPTDFPIKKRSLVIE